MLIICRTRSPVILNSAPILLKVIPFCRILQIFIVLGTFLNSSNDFAFGPLLGFLYSLSLFLKPILFLVMQYLKYLFMYVCNSCFLSSSSRFDGVLPLALSTIERIVCGKLRWHLWQRVIIFIKSLSLSYPIDFPLSSSKWWTSNRRLLFHSRPHHWQVKLSRILIFSRFLSRPVSPERFAIIIIVQ